MVSAVDAKITHLANGWHCKTSTTKTFVFVFKSFIEIFSKVLVLNSRHNLCVTIRFDLYYSINDCFERNSCFYMLKGRLQLCYCPRRVRGKFAGLFVISLKMSFSSRSSWLSLR